MRHGADVLLTKQLREGGIGKHAAGPGWEHQVSRRRKRPRFSEDLSSALRERDAKGHACLHALGWNRPHRTGKVHLAPTRTPDLTGTRGSKELDRI